MPFAEPFQLSTSPKQFQVRSSYAPIYQFSSPDSKTLDSVRNSREPTRNERDWTLRVSNTRLKLPPIQNKATVSQDNHFDELRNLTKTPFDPDFVLPDEVRQTLLLEGLPKTLVDVTLSPGEKRQKRAEEFNRVEMMKRNAVIARKIMHKALSATPSSKSPRHSKQKTAATEKKTERETQNSSTSDRRADTTESKEKRTNDNHIPTVDTSNAAKLNLKHSPAATNVIDENPGHPRIMVTSRVAESSIEASAKQILSSPEQHHDRVLPNTKKIVSSTVPHYLSLKGAIKQDEDIIFVTYDFETADFEDILESMQKEIERREEVKKARSIMIVCQGGPSYLYLLKGIVVTPQKLKREDYTPVVEFWKCLGRSLSKLFPEGGIHILGPDSRDGDVKKLQGALSKAIKPTRTMLRVVTDDSPKDKSILETYFHYKRFQFWKANKHSSVESINFADMYDSDEDVARSWSDIAESENEDLDET